MIILNCIENEKLKNCGRGHLEMDSIKIKQVCDECLNQVRELDIAINHRIPKLGIENEIELCRLVGQQEAYWDIHMKLHQLLEQENQ